MRHGRYIGDNSALVGRGLLARPGLSKSSLLVQFDDTRTELDYGWHSVRKSDVELDPQICDAEWWALGLCQFVRRCWKRSRPVCWQDAALWACQVGFLLALVPTVYGEHKPHLVTCLATAVLCLNVAYVLRSLRLHWSSMIVASTGAVWLLLALQAGGAP